MSSYHKGKCNELSSWTEYKADYKSLRDFCSLEFEEIQ
jgi:hypothetical protein